MYVSYLMPSTYHNHSRVLRMESHTTSHALITSGPDISRSLKDEIIGIYLNHGI